MKRASAKLQLKRRLELVRTTIRELTPTQLGRIKGQIGVQVMNTIDVCPTECCPDYSY
jgi:hypothetical protein